jgi:RNA polymerase sigma-70 factor (ECF subfamily)
VTLESQEQKPSPPEVRQRAERDLVEAARKDAAAFGKLYDLHFARIYSYAYYRTRNHADAEEVAAQTFQQALEHMGSYEWRGIPFAAWLYRIASNLIAGRHRGRLPETGLDAAAELRARDPLPEEAALEAERAREVRAAVATLPASQQQAVVLRFSQGLRNREIGEVMGCSEGAVKQLLHRAMENLRSRMER